MADKLELYENIAEAYDSSTFSNARSMKHIATETLAAILKRTDDLKDLAGSNWISENAEANIKTEIARRANGR